MRTGFLYGLFISVGILLGTFNDNPFWMITVPTALTFLAVITVTHAEQQKKQELEKAQGRTMALLKEQRNYKVENRYDVFSDKD